jgi:histidinol dehydrogenase
MKILIHPDSKELDNALLRPVQQYKKIKKIVKPIIKKVKEQGDRALFKYSREYDHADLDTLIVGQEEIKKARDLIDGDLKNAINMAIRNITAFHKAQIEGGIEVETMPGVVCSRKSVPVQKVGLYIPGGTAPLFSTVLMLGIPAKLAGCETIVLCTPPGKNGRVHPAILYTADLVGINTMIKVGGAQAIAAMAYGTESVPRVYKIFGPGNQYVTAAKQIVAQKGTAIDMPAGPSEVAVYADSSSNPDFVASDLLSQAEHGPDSQVLLVTTDTRIANSVVQAMSRQLDSLPRAGIAQEAIGHSRAIIAADVQEAFDIINRYAPEHLIIASDDAAALAEGVHNAGSVFLGHFTPEAAGDYASGTNHTLPTYGAARAFSGVSVDSFVKKITYQHIDERGIGALGPAVEVMAAAELLQAHKNAITVRLNALGK